MRGSCGEYDDAVVSSWYGCSLAESLSVSGTKVEVQKVERGEPNFEWGLGCGLWVVVLCSAVEVLIADVRSLLIRPSLAS